MAGRVRDWAKRGLEQGERGGEDREKEREGMGWTDSERMTQGTGEEPDRQSSESVSDSFTDDL